MNMQDTILKLPSKLTQRGLGPLPLVPLVSAHIAVDPNCRYEGLLHFSHFHDVITFVGGINKPKLVKVLFPRFQTLARDTRALSPADWAVLHAGRARARPGVLLLQATMYSSRIAS